MWADELITQVCSYAGRGSLKHEDALDSATGALRYLIDNFAGAMTVPVLKDEPREVELLVPQDNPYSA